VQGHNIAGGSLEERQLTVSANREDNSRAARGVTITCPIRSNGPFSLIDPQQLLSLPEIVSAAKGRGILSPALVASRRRYRHIVQVTRKTRRARCTAKRLRVAWRQSPHPRGTQSRIMSAGAIFICFSHLLGYADPFEQLAENRTLRCTQAAGSPVCDDLAASKVRLNAFGVEIVGMVATPSQGQRNARVARVASVLARSCPLRRASMAARVAGQDRQLGSFAGHDTLSHCAAKAVGDRELVVVAFGKRRNWSRTT